MRQVVLGNPLEREPLADLQLAGVRAQRLAAVVGAVRDIVFDGSWLWGFRIDRTG